LKGVAKKGEKLGEKNSYTTVSDKKILGKGTIAQPPLEYLMVHPP